MKTRSLKILIFSLFLALIATQFLPKHLETSFGNKLVENIQKYHLLHHKLPETGEWKTLKELDFEMTGLGTNPEYVKIDDHHYKLLFVKGFDGPYLTYTSAVKQWTTE